MRVNLECLDDAIAEVVAFPYSLHVCACVCVNGAHVCYTCGGQRTVSFVLPLCGLWEPNSGLQPWQQAPLPTVTSPATIISFILNGVALTGLELVDQAVL